MDLRRRGAGSGRVGWELGEKRVELWMKALAQKKGQRWQRAMQEVLDLRGKVEMLEEAARDYWEETPSSTQGEPAVVTTKGDEGPTCGGSEGS